jgi:hypothetical protein
MLPCESCLPTTPGEPAPTTDARRPRPRPRPRPLLPPRPLSQVWGSKTPLTLRTPQNPALQNAQLAAQPGSLDHWIVSVETRSSADLSLSFNPPPSLVLSRSSDGFFARTRPLSPGLTITQTKSTPRCLRTKGQGQGQGQEGDHPCIQPLNLR